MPVVPVHGVTAAVLVGLALMLTGATELPTLQPDQSLAIMRV